jgi:hypothetical protein
MPGHRGDMQDHFVFSDSLEPVLYLESLHKIFPYLPAQAGIAGRE